MTLTKNKTRFIDHSINITTFIDGNWWQHYKLFFNQLLSGEYINSFPFNYIIVHKIIYYKLEY